MATVSKDKPAADTGSPPAPPSAWVERVSGAELSAVLDLSGCGLALIDGVTGRFLECNRAMLRLLGVAAAELAIGKKPVDFSPQQQPGGKPTEEFANDWFGRAAHGAPSRFDWTLRRPDGVELVAEVSTAPAGASEKPLLLTSWIVRSPHAVDDEPDRFRRLVEGMTQEYFLYGNDLECRLTYVSPSVKSILGYDASELLGRDWRDFVPDAAWRAAAERTQQAAFDGADPPPVHFEIVHADGSPRMIEVVTRPVFGRGGAVEGVEGICKDVTDLKRVERERIEELRHRLRFEDLLVTLSTGFINVPVEQIDLAMSDAVRRIGEFTGVDRCFIYGVDQARGEASMTHEWTAPGVPSVKEQMQGVSTADHDWALQRLVSDRTLHVPDVEAMPPEASALRQLFRRLGVRSSVLVPMLGGGGLIGMLGFISTRGPKLWREEDIDLVQVLAEVLVNALDRCRAERAVRDSETRYRAIVEDQLDLIVRWRPDGVQTFVNEAVCRLFDETQQDLVGKTIYDRIHPDDASAVRQKIRSLTREQPFAVDEHRVVAPDGAVVWMQWVDRALFDKSAEPVEYQSIGRDITELRETQDSLRSRLEFERLVLDISTRFINIPTSDLTDGITAALGEVGAFTGVDRSYVYLLEDPGGATPNRHARLAYQWSAEGVPPVDPSLSRLDLGDFPWAAVKLDRDEPVHVPTLDSLDGVAPWWKERLGRLGLRSYLNVPMVVDDRLTGYLGFSTFGEEKLWSDDDISLLRLVGEILRNALARDEAHRSLRLSEERLRLAVETVEDGLFDWDIPGRALFVSDHTLRTYGLEDGENDRDPDNWRSLIHPDDRARVELALDKHLYGETPRYEVEYRFQNLDGGYGWRYARGQVVERSDDGEPLRMLGVDRDVTEQVQQEGKTRELETQLAHLGRVAAMGETVAGIAHEVNQPLHAAATFCAAARTSLNSGRPDAVAKGSELVQKVGEQVNRAGDIIRSLREFTRPQPSAMRPLDLNAIVREAAALTAHIPNRTGVRLQFQLEDPLPQVDGDTIQLQQVVVNLLQNAYESLKQTAGAETNSGATVVVTTRVSGEMVELGVSDNGPACTLDNPDVVFDPFFTTKPGGMGIGLALCRSIAEAHSGSISAKRNPGGGLRFTLSLPASLKSPAPPSDRSAR